MAQLQMTKHAVCRLAMLAATITLAAAGAAQGEQASAGRLRIDGQGITQLVLKDAQGRLETLNQPGSIAMLPPGEYSLDGITLEGGHRNKYQGIPPTLRVTVDANSIATLKVGAPLRQVVTVQRQGPTLSLEYALLGQGGEAYAIDRSPNLAKPAFTAYRGDIKVASGEFEFG